MEPPFEELLDCKIVVAVVVEHMIELVVVEIVVKFDRTIVVVVIGE
jgi:hypothetical protein